MEANDSIQQWLSLGLGGVLIVLVGYSIWKLIAGWMSFARTQEHSSDESRERAEALQEKLNQEIAQRVALEVEVHFLKKEIVALEEQIRLMRARLEELEQ